MVLLFSALGLLAVVVVYDLLQRQHAILRNFPIIGHVRYWLEAVGPELRQYIVTNNNEERPFSRDQRRWVYASSKQADTSFGFGSDQDMERQSNYLVIKHQTFPLQTPVPGDPAYDPQCTIACAKVLGAARGRAKAFRPASVVNVSGMSFGSLSGPAVEALNRGAQIAGCLHNTGEGGVSPYHLNGGDLVWQIGTGYFGCREADGRFSMARLQEAVARCPQIRAIEIKLSQGAKPGAGGLLPRAKISAEIAETRGIPRDRDCASPAAHSAFGTADALLDFVESIAATTGLPVGIKAAVGDATFWTDLAQLMATGTRGRRLHRHRWGRRRHRAPGRSCSRIMWPLPFKIGFSRVQQIFHAGGLHQRIVFVGSGRLGFPEAAVFAFGLGCDVINVGREALLAIGLHSGPALPHEPLPDRYHDPASLAHSRPGLDPEGRAARQLRCSAQERVTRREPRVRCATPRAHHGGSPGAARQPVRLNDGGGLVRVRTWVRAPLGRGCGGSPPPAVVADDTANMTSSGGRRLVALLH